jgi:serine protease Do
VVAIGNPFGYLLSNNEPSVTAGVVSALGRHIVPSGESEGFYLGMIQTDASINPGNSGGPLINALGQVVGVNSSIFSRSGGSEGLGFAIPIDRALRIARDLADDGTIERAWLGLDVDGVEADEWGRTRGVMISRVVGGSPAAEANLRPGRRVLAVNDRRLAAPLDWQDALLELRPGNRVRLELEGEGAVELVAERLPSVSAPRVRALDGVVSFVTLSAAIRGELGLASEAGALVAEADVSLTRRSGLQPGDVLVQVNNTRITSADEAQRVLEQLPNGRARFVIERRGGYVYQDVVWQR